MTGQYRRATRYSRTRCAPTIPSRRRCRRGSSIPACRRAGPAGPVRPGTCRAGTAPWSAGTRSSSPTWRTWTGHISGSSSTRRGGAAGSARRCCGMPLTARRPAGGRSCPATIQEGSPGEAFALRVGAALGIADVRRVQDLAKIPAEAITRLRETAAGAASGYSLVRWIGVTPEERIDQVAAVHEALNDSPRDAAVEPTAWTPERVRGRMNARIARSPMRRYSLAALHDDTGEMAALTVRHRRSRRSRLGSPADHGGDQAAPWSPARPAGQDGDAGLAGRDRTAA